ncbi:methionine--tRNA ligase [Bartonella sp. TP]|uniref:methionine--tRNA ligase n=1 Tax=Bartonella sp. TP TaxID=3057550 RepID=UPI0025B17C99|nr:methionine--tRNA ligase [Bartonella sp. TP]WJW79968.1 methionine--tRNA ligase [Bartonella sp. TP]
MQRKFYITTPIFYPNGQPHIGHAYNSIASDCLARFERLKGSKVLFVSGTDEHGLKMQQTAQKLGLQPQELADKNSQIFKDMLAALNCSNDDFIRTTQPRHAEACKALWQKMEAAGDIYLAKYSGWYSVRQEAYYDEADTMLTEDGQRVEKEVGSPVEWNEEESYFFRLSKYQDRLLQYYDEHPEFIAPHARRNEIYSFVKAGLKDLSISRTSFNWGIKVPGNNRHIMYVWVDALTNYLTATGFPEATDENYFWPADLHVIGKDIIRFHAIYWPAFLMSANIDLPKRIFAHGFLLNKGEKMSKSVGNVVSPFDLINLYGVDQIRYFLMKEVIFGQDGSYSHAAIVNRINADLANDLGNLLQRSLALLAKNCDNIVPARIAYQAEDEEVLEQTAQNLQEAIELMETQQISLALNLIFQTVGATNRYFAAAEPWVLKNTNVERFNTVLYTTLEILRQLGILLQAFIPNSAEKLLDLLAIEPSDRLIRHIKTKPLPQDQVLPAATPLFPRYIENRAE